MNIRSLYQQFISNYAIMLNGNYTEKPHTIGKLKGDTNESINKPR